MEFPIADLAVIGGGVIGLTLAWRAALSGLKVSLIERHEIGKESSWAGAGMLPAGAKVALPNLDPLEALRSLSHPLHVEWAEELRESTSIDNGFRRCGGLYLARSRGELASLLAQQHWWDSLAIRYETWDLPTLQTHRSTLRYDSEFPVRGWFVPDDAQLRNPRHLQALRFACEILGVKIFEQTPLIDWRVESSRVQSLQTSTGVVHAANYCLTSGAWTGRLVEPLGCHLDIFPVRGQMVLYQQGIQTEPAIVNDGHRYLVIRDDGRVLAGSCEEEVGFRNETTSVMVDDLHQWATTLMPTLGQAKIEKAWAGLRPATVDGFPYLGKVPGIDNAFVAAGHFRHGLHWSTATANLMLDLIYQRPTPIDLSPFSLQRGQMPLARTGHPHADY